MRRAGFVISLLLLGCTSLVAQGNDVVVKAMKDEMARSIEKLRLSELDKPYFIVYRVTDTKTFTVNATLGALTKSDNSKSRRSSVDVKVGDYALDNTNFVNTKEIGMRMASLGSNFSSVTLDDDYLQVRRALWRATDSEYKDAAEKLAAKRSVLQNRQGSKMLPDFEKAAPVESLEARAEMKIDIAALETLVRKASAQFKADPNVLNSSVGIVIRQQYVRYLNSEGTLMTFNEPMVTFAATASTQAKDGTPLSDTTMQFASSVSELDEAKLMKDVKTLEDRLSGLRTAKSLDRYNGPVLFEGQAAGQLMAQVFAPSIVASRFPMSDEPQFETQIRQFLAQMGGASLSDRMGARVLPEWIDVIDRPREKQWNGVSTLGAANYDDEGVATRDTTIVSHGVLKAMLATRIPSEDASATTGSAHGLGASPSNLYTVARKTSTETELRQQLLAMAKERGFDYGIVVRDIGLAGLSWVRRVNSMADNNGISIATGTGIYKVFADGHEEQIRDVEFAPVTTTSLKEIVAAGDKPVLHESPFIPMAGSILAMAGGGGLGGELEHVCSFITPSLLVDDLTLKHTDTPAPNGPTVPSPLVQQTAMK